MFDLVSVLKLLPTVGPVIAALPEFKKVYDQIAASFAEKDQQTLQEAYRDLMAENDEGHARLQEKLMVAAGS